ncbi:alpha/beta hydrolase domain-containing protein 17B-like [Chironomus tepperi]|uniref:alpha/beta hydrolase domain-containing protein 17B-like n=1 Tax=Chironomus tepperi TaxID=113505 RepID=UPI00391F939F
MSNLSFIDLFHLLCCPPCPSQITQKMAFLPPKVTYDLKEVEENGDSGTTSKDKSDKEKKYDFVFMPEYAENGLDEKFIKEYFDGFYTKTKKGNKIACLHIRSPKTAKFTFLFSHGNAADLGMLTAFYCRLVHQLNINIFSYDYSGYGRSSGTASEKNLYSDIEAAWHVLLKRYDLKRENVILYGQSIGTACACDLATKYETAGVILHSPLMSGIRLLFPVKRTWICDAFPIIDKVSKIKSPTLVIHGTHDEIINFSHGLQIYDQLQNAVEPLWIKGAHHNDIEQYKAYFERLQNFMNSDLSSNK